MEQRFSHPIDIEQLRMYRNKHRDAQRATRLLIASLRNHLNIEYEQTEEVYLFGRERTDWAMEQLVGKLVGIMPGLVILEDVNHQYDQFSGMLQRSVGASGEAFALKPLHFEQGGRLVIMPFDDERAPASIWIRTKEKGDDSKEAVTYIDAARWGTLRAWLDKWLPVTT